MAWRYTQRRERRTPPCRDCQGLSSVVRLSGDLYVCMEHMPRRAFEATWVDDADPLPISADDLTDEGRAALAERLAGIGDRHRAGFVRGYVDGLLDAPRLGAAFKERS